MADDAGRAFLDLVKRRRSVRAYRAQPVERGKIERCLEAARLAPSACNSQPWSFVVLEDEALRAQVASASGGGLLPLNHFVRQAPVLVVVVAEPAAASARAGAWLKQKPFALMDVAIAAEHFCLQAAAEGLGTCILGWFDEDRVRSLLAIPYPARPALILAMGYAADEPPKARKRKPPDILFGWNTYPGAPAQASQARTGWRSALVLAAWLAFTYAAAAVGAMATAQAGAFYTGLARPAWAPPGWLFGPVWTLLYTLMAVAAWRVWRVRGLAAMRGAGRLYLVQLAVNALWSWWFFAWRQGAVAFLWCLLLAMLVAATIRRFDRVDRTAARLLWPYQAWVVFATVLAFAIWRMNPGVM